MTPTSANPVSPSYLSQLSLPPYLTLQHPLPTLPLHLSHLRHTTKGPRQIDHMVHPLNLRDQILVQLVKFWGGDLAAGRGREGRHGERRRELVLFCGGFE